MAIKGLVDPKRITLPVSVRVNNWKEPNVRIGEKPIELSASLYISNVEKYKSYNIYMFDDHVQFPTDSDFENASYKSRFSFVGNDDNEEYIFKYPYTIMSDQMAYFAVVPSNNSD